MPNMHGPDAIWSRKGAKYEGKYSVGRSACPLVDMTKILSSSKLTQIESLNQIWCLHTKHMLVYGANECYTISYSYGEISGTTLAGLEFGQLEFVN